MKIPGKERRRQHTVTPPLHIVYIECRMAELMFEGLWAAFSGFQTFILNLCKSALLSWTHTSKKNLISLTACILPEVYWVPSQKT